MFVYVDAEMSLFTMYVQDLRCVDPVEPLHYTAELHAGHMCILL